ncbi:hypothetical protein [Paenibacillus planticolens]|uniref:Uncharacterized protein n=1 Tax=Paenibacillus planticolens TaxID=2654976 RepID=A0ABX1ZMU0_9BACL|nr:hypothetical protein [Paenibacillus planticolens]NOV00335.1 hypothetical protein [Paenibacillus planticolens]
MNHILSNQFAVCSPEELFEVNGGQLTASKAFLIAGAALLSAATIIVAAPAVAAGGTLAAAAWTGAAVLGYNVGALSIISGVTLAINGR